MRLVQVMVPTGKRQAVLRTLDDEGIDYAVTDETSQRDYAAVVSFPLPTEAVEPVLERLREAGIERDAYTVVVAAETVVSKRFEHLTDEYEETEESSRIAREELVARAADLAPKWTVFLVLTATSAVVATAGLLLDSPAVVVGSMVIAPLIGPAMATSVGTVLDDRELFVRGSKLQVVGGVLAVASAALFALALRLTGIVPLTGTEVLEVGEVQKRLAPDVLSLAVALGAGLAGALSLSSGVSSALVGVMIAAALVPPTAVVGIGFAWGEPSAVLGSAVLVLVNYLSINFAALAVLWYAGYRPEHWFQHEEAREATLKRIAALGAGILLLTAVLGGATYTSYQTSIYEKEVRDVTLSTAHENGLSLLSVQYRYDGFPVRKPTRVVATLSYRLDDDPPPVAAALSGRVRTVAERRAIWGDPNVTVEVRYVPVERAD